MDTETLRDCDTLDVGAPLTPTVLLADEVGAIERLTDAERLTELL